MASFVKDCAVNSSLWCTSGCDFGRRWRDGMETKTSSYGKRRFWKWAAASIMVRLLLIYHSKTLNLAARPELSTSDQHPATVKGLPVILSAGFGLKFLGLDKMLESSEIIHFGVIAALIYLWNPMTILTCVGFSITPIENLIVILTLYGASTSDPSNRIWYRCSP